MKNFELDMAELLEVDTVNENDALKDFEAWDSLTVLSIIAYADENFGLSLTAREVNDAQTIGGLKSLISSKTKS